MNGPTPTRAFTGSIAVLVAAVAVGLVAFGITWRGLARIDVVARQVPFVVSGALGGLGLLGFALGVLRPRGTFVPSAVTPSAPIMV